jgi:protein-S-isoprenylcysteine O-methyltransferase
VIALSDPRLLGDLFGLSELALLLARRSRGGARAADRGSLLLLWGVIVASIVAAIYCSITVRAADSALLRRLVPLGCVLYVGGLILRWYSIMYLGKYFTVDVAIAADHQVVETGPYRYIRHPSYTGALLALVGLGICYRNWLGLVLLVVPVSLAFLYRIRVEEAALRHALGDAYARYSTRTRRLVPFIY